MPPASASGSTAEAGPAAEPNSIHHKASKYAIGAIAASFGISLLSTAIRQQSGGVAQVISIICGMLFISAIPAGIIALCGLKKYGPRKLLWRGLVGVLFPILLTAIAIPAFLAVRSSASILFIKNVASQINQGTPKMIDEVTRLDKATAGPGRLLTVDLTVTSVRLADIDRNAWDTNVRPVLKAGIIASASPQVLSDNGKITYRYADSGGAIIDEITITENDLPKK